MTTLNRRFRKRRPFVILAALATVLLGVVAVAQAAPASAAVGLPLVFFSETGETLTSACLQVIERRYPAGRWIDGDSEVSTDDAGRALRSVLGAIGRKDRAELLRLADPVRGADPAQFDQQANALFRQFQTMRILAVPKAYEFDGLVVFFAEIQSGKRTFFAPFVFSVMKNGRLGYLPYRTEQLGYVLVRDWFDSQWGPSHAVSPAYCPDEQLRRATHKASLAGATGGQSLKTASQLFLQGSPLGTAGGRGTVAERARTTIEALSAAARRNDLEGVARQMASVGASRLRQWYPTAEQLDRERYMSALADLRPRFVFDASPLVIVYALSPADGPQALYLTPGAGNVLLWTNSSHLTVADELFKQGPLIEAAGQDTPFGALAIRR